jgi:hypothetical protein
MPLVDSPLTAAERKALRRLLRDEERASWAWKRLRIVTPIVVGVMVAMWQAWDWVAKHVRFSP